MKSIIISLGILGFVLTIIALHMIQTNHSPFYQLISELALGKYGSFMLVGFFSFSIAVFTSQQVLALYKNSMSIRILLLIASFFLASAGIFKLGEHTNLHVALVAGSFVLIVLSMYLVPRFIPQFQERTSVIICWVLGGCAVISVGLGHGFIPIGIAQKLAACCILIWLLWLAIFHQNHRGKQKTNNL